MDHLQKSSIQLKFRHFQMQFWSTFRWNFQPKPLQAHFLCKNGPFAEKFWSTFGHFQMIQLKFRHFQNANFGQLLDGISNQNHFRHISYVKMDHLQKSSIQLKFRHFQMQFWSTFRWNFQPKPLQAHFLCKNGPFAEKFDPAQILPFSNAILVNF